VLQWAYDEGSLDKEQVFDLLAAVWQEKDGSKIPGLFQALQNNRHAAIKAWGQLLQPYIEKDAGAAKIWVKRLKLNFFARAKQLCLRCCGPRGYGKSVEEYNNILLQIKKIIAHSTKQSKTPLLITNTNKHKNE
jgi:hypothetical protein